MPKGGRARLMSAPFYSLSERECVRRTLLRLLGLPGARVVADLDAHAAKKKRARESKAQGRNTGGRWREEGRRS